MEHIKLYFIIFGAVDLEIWIKYHLNKFLENIYQTKSIQNAKCTRTPSPEVLTCGTPGSADPTRQTPSVSAAVDRPGSHHR